MIGSAGMRHIALILGASILLATTGGCSHQLSAGARPGVNMQRYHTYFVVTDKQDNEVAQAITKDLHSRGKTATSGLDWAIPADAQVKVLFHEKWVRDVTPYLRELSIDMVDAHSGAALAGGRCVRNSGVRKPPAEMVREIIDRIYSSPAVSPVSPSSSPAP
jgi:hypothetical protein